MAMFSFQPPMTEELRTLLIREVKDNLPTQFLTRWRSETAFAAFDKEYAQYGFPKLEYAIVFRYEADIVQNIHIDGESFERKRNASLNVIIDGGNAEFQWFTGVTYENSKSTNNIGYVKVNTDDAQLVHSEPVPPVHLVCSGIPHRVVTPTPMTLLCLRFTGNPSVSELQNLLF